MMTLSRYRVRRDRLYLAMERLLLVYLVAIALVIVAVALTTFGVPALNFPENMTLAMIAAALLIGAWVVYTGWRLPQ